MAYPGTYNFSYYKGDTLEFNIYPKDGNGNLFPLDGYGNAKFTIGTRRGNTAIQIEGYASIENDHIACAIMPGNAHDMVAGTTYVYDVEVSKSGPNYDYVHTLLTGTIDITEQVTGAYSA